MAASVATEQPVPAAEHSPPAAAPEPELRLKGLKEGQTHEQVPWGKVSVSNAAGQARSSIHLQSRWHVPPEALFAIFTYPDNSAIFRDVKTGGGRRVVTSAPGYKEVEVQQLQDLKVLWVRRQFSTWLKVVEDARDPECLRINFDLLKSDVLAQFSGRWEITPIYEEQPPQEQQQQGEGGSSTPAKVVVGCQAVLHQQVLPKGIPPFMQNVPVMGDLLRSITMRAIRRVMDDAAVAVDKIQAGLKAGRTVQDVLRELCGVFDEEGHANGAVKSFAVDGGDEEEEEEEEEQGKEEGKDAENKEEEEASQGAQEEAPPPPEQQAQEDGAQPAAAADSPAPSAGGVVIAAAPTAAAQAEGVVASLEVAGGEEGGGKPAEGVVAASAVPGAAL